MSWNDYPKHVAQSLIKRFSKKLNEPPKSKTDNDISDDDKLYIKVPYLGNRGKRLVNDLVKKLRRYLKTNVVFITKNSTKKISMFCPSKDRTPKHQKSNLIYKIVCPGCQETYVGKTDRCLITRLNEHDQPMYRHLIDCNKFHEVASLFNLPHSIGLEEVDEDSFVHNAVINNAVILDITRNWSQNFWKHTTLRN